MNDELKDFYSLPDDRDVKWESVLLRLLATPKTRRELERRLGERGCPRGTIDELLDRYEQSGLIDDRAYAVLYIDSKRDFGLLRLRDELRVRGVDRDLIEEVLDEAEIDEEERALNLIDLWAGRPGMTPEKLDARLRRRGFTGTSVRAALQTWHEQNEESEGDE